jgi:hypothetical protein
LIQLFPPDDERLSLETCRGGKINTLKKVKKCVKLVENPQWLYVFKSQISREFVIKEICTFMYCVFIIVFTPLPTKLR